MNIYIRKVPAPAAAAAVAAAAAAVAAAAANCCCLLRVAAAGLGFAAGYWLPIKNTFKWDA